MKKVTLAVAATLAIASAVPVSAGNANAYTAPVILPPEDTSGSSLNGAAIAGLLLLGIAAAGASR